MMIIVNHTIQAVNGLYSANDLHKASGGQNKYSPFRFMRLTSNKTLIAEIERSPDMVNVNNGIAYKSNTQRTWICRELEQALSNAGHFLSVGGNQKKPELNKAIDQVVVEMQPQLKLALNHSLPRLKITTYLDQDNKLNTLDDELLNGDIGGDDE